MKYTVGIDEVGRGSLAGPVVVSAVAVPKDLKIPPSLKLWRAGRNHDLGRLRDSKKLSAKQREAWYVYFKSHPKIFFTVARVYPRTIDRVNISRAANLAALRAFRRLLVACRMSPVACKAFLDGGLYLGNGERDRGAGTKTIIRGDEKFVAIKIASIIAKVHRDNLMKRLARQYPEYGFEIHKGYGTKIHLAAIKKHGPSEAHRLTFTLG